MIWTAATKHNGARRARKAGKGPCAAFAAVLLLAAASGRAQEYGRFGLALKSGAAAGPMGIQLALNLSPHYQLCAGGGCTSDILYLFDRGRTGTSFKRTDSYFFMGKYYLEHVFFEMGYGLKVTKSENIQSDQVRRSSLIRHAIPMHVGYEFGHRRGFYFASSIGYFYVVGEKGVEVQPDLDVGSLTGAVSAGSGPTVGISVGYYLY
jgi:hypothetical protein